MILRITIVSIECDMVSLSTYIKSRGDFRLYKFTIKMRFVLEFLKLKVTVYKLNYGSYLGVIIKSTIPLTEYDLTYDTIYKHPFSKIPKEVWIDEFRDDLTGINIYQYIAIGRDTYDVREAISKLNKTHSVEKFPSLLAHIHSCLQGKIEY